MANRLKNNYQFKETCSFYFSNLFFYYHNACYYNNCYYDLSILHPFTTLSVLVVVVVEYFQTDQQLLELMFAPSHRNAPKLMLMLMLMKKVVLLSELLIILELTL